MNFAVKRKCCWLVTAVSSICLDTYLSPVNAETIPRNQEINKGNFNYESLTNTWGYQDLQKKIEQEEASALLTSNYNGLNSSELIPVQRIEPDDLTQEYTLSTNYILPEFETITEGIKQVTKSNNIALQSVHSFDKTLQESTDFLLADEPLPPSQQGIFWNPARPDSHAPIAVMGEHIHSEGEIMVSYRYMLMEMEGSRVGTDDISNEKILEQFPVTPTRMTMQMHMFGMMYGITNDLTLMAMLPYVVKDMDHITRMGRGFNTNSEGIGDIKVTGLYQVLNENRQRIHFNAGMSFPTGSIETRDRTPAGPDQLLPYPMQLGSGTLDLRPGITYLGQTDEWSWGSQIIGTLRLGTNSNSYKFGDEIMLTAWGAKKWSDWASTSLRIKGKNWGNISGKDTRLNPNIVPTADPTRRGGTQIDIGFGLNLFVPEGDLRTGRLAIEFELPIYRALQGPQLETDWQLTAGLQFSF
ncbi:MAG: hypothetical protein AB4063_06895 [Crocosphaera sp.]